MRFVPPVIAVCFALLACSGSQSSQANNSHANTTVTAPAATTVSTGLITKRVSGAQARSIMHERHEGMETIGKTNKAISRELKGSSPDLGIVRAGAAKIAGLSRQASGWFPAGTGPDVGKTGAKPEIWQSPDDFAVKLANFQKAAQAFNGVASSHDLEGIKRHFSDLGGACKACHDKYRSEMHH